ncbi:MAG: proton-conducting membrane transporter [Clostridia bacterium]|nr:proton-conducting membrane transporter [Clostridia bacterium]
MILYFFIFVPIIVGTVVYLIPGKMTKILAFLLQGLMLALAIYNFINVVSNGDIVQVIGSNLSITGITLVCDKISAALLILTTFIFFICFLFGLLDKFVNNLFIFLFIILQALIIGIFLTRDLFNIYVLVEVSTIIVSVLIMFKKDSVSLYDGMVYFISNIAAMTLFLFGVAILYKTFGVLDIDVIKVKMQFVEDTRSLILPFGLMMTGIGLKCAFLPLFSWLPKAHATASAPSIVSVILSALYVKGGIYLFIRIADMYKPAINIDWVFLTIGIMTSLFGIVLAFSQKDIKLILAYHTVSQLGLILTGLSMGTVSSYYGGLLHIFNHAMFKSVLFLCAGIIIDHYKTRDVYEIRNVFKNMPLVSIAMIMAILGITGAPFFNGSVSKYLIQGGAKNISLNAIIIIINLGTVISFIKVATIFKGKEKTMNVSVKWYKKTAVLIIGSMCLLMGLGGPVLVRTLFDYQLQMSFLVYIEKLMVYVFSLAGGYLLYSRLIRKLKFVKQGLSIDLGVNEISIAMLAFFVFLSFTTYLSLI